MTIRSQALAAALTAAVALAPAAADAKTKKPPTPPNPFHVEPKNEAAKRHIALENQALRIINAAMGHVRGTVSGCAMRSPFSGRATPTHDTPSPDFMNAIAALRRPATPAELAAGRDSLEHGLDDATYVDYRRDVTAADGAKLTIMMGRRVIKPYIIPAKCLDAEHALIVKQLAGKPHALRSATLQEFGHIRTGLEANAKQPVVATPQDDIYLFHNGGGGGGGTFKDFMKYGVFGSSGGNGDATLDGLVPDGVATVKLIYPKVVPRGKWYKPKVFPSGFTRTLRVQENVVSARIPRSAPDAFPKRMLWLDATGKVLNDTTFP